MRTEDYQRREEELAGWPVGLVSYKLGDKYVCEIDNVSPGARIARAEGPTGRRPNATPRPPRPAASPAPRSTM